jgi:hypothetical protein
MPQSQFGRVRKISPPDFCRNTDYAILAPQTLSSRISYKPLAYEQYSGGLHSFND